MGSPRPFIGSVYTGARRRVISLFLSPAGVQGRGTLFVPSCLRATICFYQKLPGDVNSHLPVCVAVRFLAGFHPYGGTAKRSYAVYPDPRGRSIRWARKSSGKSLSPDEEPRTKGKMARVSHVSLPMITLFSRAPPRLAFIIHTRDNLPSTLALRFPS